MRSTLIRCKTQTSAIYTSMRLTYLAEKWLSLASLGQKNGCPWLRSMRLTCLAEKWPSLASVFFGIGQNCGHVPELSGVPWSLAMLWLCFGDFLMDVWRCHQRRRATPRGQLDSENAGPNGWIAIC